MKPLKEVGLSYLALSEGEHELQQGLFENAAASYRRAMEVARTIPEDEAFDYDGFDAIAHTGLSGALVKLERYADALDSTERALRYFNRRGELHQDEGKQWIEAVLNRASALEGIGRFEEALNAFRTVGEMMSERKGELRNKERQQRIIEQHIKKLEAVLPDKKPAGYKAWWEFWS